MTNEILPAAYAPDIQDREQFLLKVEQFLSELFFVPPRHVHRQHDYPPLSLLLSLIDMAVDLKHALGVQAGTRLRGLKARR